MSIDSRAARGFTNTLFLYPINNNENTDSDKQPSISDFLNYYDYIPQINPFDENLAYEILQEPNAECDDEILTYSINIDAVMPEWKEYENKIREAESISDVTIAISGYKQLLEETQNSNNITDCEVYIYCINSLEEIFESKAPEATLSEIRSSIEYFENKITEYTKNGDTQKVKKWNEAKKILNDKLGELI